jgi:hypothetical protein
VTCAQRVSVVVPAHNEEQTIARCLDALLDQGSDHLDVVVSANACRDRTVAVAREHGVQVLDRSEPGKAAALVAGDEVSRHFPRVYVDADVVLDGASLLALVRALDVPEPRLATPTRRLDLGTAGPLVRLYYRTWERLQQARGDQLGGGVYAVNAAGRRRWDAFPSGIADDYFVHTRFRPHERVQVPGAVSVVRPPRTIGALLGVRARVYAGNDQHALVHGRLERPAPRYGLLLRDPVALLGLPVYAAIVLTAKRAARRRVDQGTTEWTRDTSGRAA